MIFRALFRVVEFLLVLLFARILFRGLFGLVAPRPRRVDPASSRPRTLEAEEMVKDPICNTFVPKKAALVARLSGADCYFCSEACRRKAIEGLRRAS